MITAEWVQLMARHNAWQNGWMADAIEGLSDDDARADRKLFFGSILGTANHLLWGDIAWLNRLGAGPAPAVDPSENTRLTASNSEWAGLRRETDAAILAWADGLAGMIEGDLLWKSALTGAEHSTNRAVAISHLFLHGVHHRGQLHAALTQAGVKTPDTDLPLMPGLK